MRKLDEFPKLYGIGRYGLTGIKAYKFAALRFEGKIDQSGMSQSKASFWDKGI